MNRAETLAFEDEEKPSKVVSSEEQQGLITSAIRKGRLAMAAAVFAAIGSTAIGYRSVASYPTEADTRFKETSADLRRRHPELSPDKIPFFGETDQIDEVVDRALNVKKDAPEFNRILRRYKIGDALDGNQVDKYTLEHQNTQLVRFLISNPPLVDELAKNDQLRKELFDFMEMEMSLCTDKQLFYGKMGMFFLLFPALAIGQIIKSLKRVRKLKARLAQARSKNEWNNVESILEQLKALNVTIEAQKAMTASLEAQKSALIDKLNQYKIKETPEVPLGEVFRADGRKMRLAEIGTKIRIAIEQEDVEALEALMTEAKELDIIEPEEKKKATV